MTSSPRSFHRLALASALLVWSTRAAAREPTAVALYTLACSPREDAALRQALAVELRAIGVEPHWGATDAAGAPARFTLRAECDAENDNVALRLWSSEPEPRETRSPRRVSPNVEEVTNAEVPVGPGSTRPSPAQRGRGEPGPSSGHEALVLARTVALRDVAAPARARTLALVISEALGPALALGDEPALPEPTLRRPPLAVAHTAAGTDDEATSAPLPERAEPPRARSRRTSAFSRANPYGQLDELYSTSNPYGLGRAFRIGTGALGRMAMRDSSVLLGLELGANGPLSESADWAFEVSHSSSTAWTSELEASWWSSAIGFDWVDVKSIGLALGPRLSFGHLSISDLDPYDPSTERTLVTQLGFRGKLDFPVGERLSVQMTLSGHRTVGVYALTSYTGLDQDLNGWVFSWGLGLGLEP